MDCELPLGADAGGGRLLAAVPRPGRGRRRALFPCPQREDSGRQTGQVSVDHQTSLRGREAALGGGAPSGAARRAEQPAEQREELLPHAAVHVAVDVRVEAALQEEEHEGEGGEPGGHGCSGAHR